MQHAQNRKKMDKIIFVFTNNGSIRNHFEVDVANHNIDLNSQDIIEFKGIYLLSDRQSKEDLEEFWSRIENIINGNENVHFIHHTKPDATVVKFIKKKGYKTYSGSHEEGIEGYQYYDPLKHLLTGVSNETEILKKWGEIFESENTLEIALNLLHDIYSGKSKSKFESNENKEIREHGSKAYEALLGQEAGEDWKYEYTQENQEKLSILRDSLLSYATQ